MSINRKNPKADLRKNYNVLFLLGVAVVLFLSIVAMKVDLRSGESDLDFSEEQEIVEMKEVVRTQQQEQPPPPPQPQVPVEVPNERVLEDQNVNFDMELDLDEELSPPPEPDNTGSGEGEEEIFMAVQNMPELIGSRAELQSQVEYPRSCRIANIEGNVIVQFVVTTTGELTQFEIIQGIGGGCDEAAIEAIREHAEFSIGQQRGNPVPVRMSFPIVFRLQ